MPFDKQESFICPFFDLIHGTFKLTPVVLDYYEHLEANKMKLNVERNNIKCPRLCTIKRMCGCAGDHD